MDSIGFDWQPRTRMVFGAGSLARLGELARELSPHPHVLLVTDRGIVEAGHAERARQILEAAQVRVTIFDQAKENPTTRTVEECLQAAKAAEINAFIGLGGGSSMDTAKGCNFLLTNGGRMQDYWGVGKAARPMLPLMAIPTTAGTGSECQSFALIADEDTHQKMACGDPKAAARVALLDPELTLSQPRRVTACTGVDAITHAVETAVTRKRTDWSRILSRESFVLALQAFPRVLAVSEAIEPRAHMQLGAALAGMAIENSMLGAAHAAANPLTAHFDIVHGQAVGLMLPHVMRYNAQEPATLRRYAELATAAALVRRRDDPQVALRALVARIEYLLNIADIPHSLAACKVPPSRIPQLAKEAAAQWTTQFNPLPVSASGFEQLYAAAMLNRGEGSGAAFVRDDGDPHPQRTSE